MYFIYTISIRKDETKTVKFYIRDSQVSLVEVKCKMCRHIMKHHVRRVSGRKVRLIKYIDTQESYTSKSIKKNL